MGLGPPPENSGGPRGGGGKSNVGRARSVPRLETGGDPRVPRDGKAPPAGLSSEFQSALPAYDANDGAARVMLTVRLSRVGRAVSDYKAGGVNLAGAAYHDVVVVQ